MPRLYELTDQLQRLYDTIVIGEDGEISSDMAAELAAIEQPWTEKADNLAGLIRNLEVESESFKAEADRMAKKAKSIGNRVDNLKQYLQDNLERLELDSVKGPRFRITLANNSRPSVCVPFVANVPLKFLRQREPEADKTAILEAIHAGQIIPGVEIVQGRHIRIS